MAEKAGAAPSSAGPSSLAVWVRMKGLPARVSVADIGQFFDGLSLGGAAPILFKRHPDGRPTGAAYVRFATASDAKSAVARDCAILSPRFGQRYVHVYALARSDVADLQATAVAAAEFDAAQQAAAENGGTEAAAVVVRNFPAEAGQAQLAAFFEGFKLHPNGLQVGYHGPTSRTGQGLVEFESAEEATRAVTQRDRQPLLPEGSKRFVRLEQITLAEMREALALRFGGEGIIRVRPVTLAEVRQQFGHLAIREVRAAPAPGEGGGSGSGPSVAAALGAGAMGTVFVEFASPGDALRALEVRPPSGPGLGPEAAPERPWSVKLATRTELLRASTVAEAQVPGMMPPGSFGSGGALAPPNGAVPGLPLLQQPFAAVAAAMRAGGFVGGGGSNGSMPGTLDPVRSEVLAAWELRAAMEARAAADQGMRTGSPGPGGSGGAGPGNIDAAASVAAAAAAAAVAAGPLPPGWSSLPHPATGAPVYVNENTGEQSWLDPRLQGTAARGTMPPPARVQRFGSFSPGLDAGTPGLAVSAPGLGGSLGSGSHSSGSGSLPLGSLGSGASGSFRFGSQPQLDLSVKAASAPAVLRPSPRYPTSGAPPILPLPSAVPPADPGRLSVGSLPRLCEMPTVSGDVELKTASGSVLRRRSPFQRPGSKGDEDALPASPKRNRADT